MVEECEREVGSPKRAMVGACVALFFMLICLFFLAGKFGRSTTKVYEVRSADGVETCIALREGEDDARVADWEEVKLLNELDGERGLEAGDRRFFWRGWKWAFSASVCALYVLGVSWAVWAVWRRVVPRSREAFGGFFERLSTSERERRVEAYSVRGVFWHSMALFVVLVGVFFGLACFRVFAFDVGVFLDWVVGFSFLT